ncbi:MAG: Xaa-Pro peptidase family protein [Acidobacteria bacterium]|nr:Xaa-Pro peptidase family protein [Acidobacteriota bacterium]
MERDDERIGRVKRALAEAGVDALVCSLPMNVLMLSGYWPVVGASLVLFAREGRVTLLVPEDEEELAGKGWAGEVRTFSTGSLEEIKSVAESVLGPLSEVARELGVGRGRVVGFEDNSVSEPLPYAAMHLYGASIRRLIGQTMRFCAVVPAGELLARLRAVLSPHEVGRVRAACRVAEEAFRRGARGVRAGLRETEIAAAFREPLSTVGTGFDGVARADGFTFCMSGENSAEAYASYQRSRGRELRDGDLALVHCNSYADGFWTDITRTFCVGAADAGKRRMYEAVFAARRAALAAIRPGAGAAEVDETARQVLTAYGFGAEFKHGLGHGVGFAAINHNAPPRLHPASTDVLEAGMVFNVEPAIYFEGYGGMRHCDVVVVTEEGAEVLTPFLSSVEELAIT